MSDTDRRVRVSDLPRPVRGGCAPWLVPRRLGFVGALCAALGVGGEALAQESPPPDPEPQAQQQEEATPTRESRPGEPPAEPDEGAAARSPERPATTVVPAQPADGDRNAVTRVIIDYVRTNEGHPDPAAVLEAEIRLSEAGDGWVAPREGARVRSISLSEIPSLSKQDFYDSALPLFAPTIVARLQELGLIGVYVEPDPEQFAVVEGEVVDRRDAEDTTLRMRITTGIVTEMRTIAQGERITGEDAQRVDNPVHDRIRRRSPVQAYEPGEEEDKAPRRDLLRRERIDDFVFRLNRHPGRRVDVAVAPSGDQPGGVTLDYLVTENRPWFLYYQVGNTGTRETDRVRHRFGFIHNQLTDSDDILILDYLTSDFSDELNALFASYERPFPGTDRLRWRAFASYLDFEASELGLPDANFESDQFQYGGEILWNFHQDRDLFFDAVAGLRFDTIDVANELAGVSGEEDFLTPYAGIRVERERESERTYASAILEFAAPGATDVDDDRLFELGRVGADDDWTKLLYEFTHSFYLEPLVGEGPDEGDTGLANELVLSARGQVAFDNRLIPQEQSVAGGLYSVRGYPQSIIAGDDVHLFSIEYRHHLPRALEPSVEPGEFFGETFRYRPQYAYGPTDWDLIIRTFLDVGRTVVHDEPAFERDETLAGFGFGFELRFTRRLSLRVDTAMAITDLENADGTVEISRGHTETYIVFTVLF